MSYDLDAGAVSAVYRPIHEIEQLVRPKTAMKFVAPGSVTAGRYGLFRLDMQPRSARHDQLMVE